MYPDNIHIGTSGWHYPDWVGPFYPRGMKEAEFLPYYARHLSTVEINNTFYHLPTQETLTHWRDEIPEDFLFTCKASRYITHMKKLKDPKESIERFFESVTVLQHKLGPILFQLPPRWRKNVSRLEAFLIALPTGFRYAFEFRDASWFDEEIYQLLMAHHAAFCLYHLAGQWSPEVVTGNFIYIRLHGPQDSYEGKYHQHQPRTWTTKCRKWSHSGKDVYCYFDNDEEGFAPINALDLLRYVNAD